MGSAEPARAARIHRRLPEPVDVVAIVSTAGSAGPPIGTAVGDGSAGLAGVGTGAGAGSVIRDVVEFRRSGLAYRPVAELNILVQAWRAAMRHAGRRADTLVHTFLGRPNLATPADREDQVVYAVRTDPPLGAARAGLLWWRRVDQLDMLVDTFARGDPPTRSPGRWLLHTSSPHRPARGCPIHQASSCTRYGPNPSRTRLGIVAPRPLPPPRPVTHLAAYAARRTDPSAPLHDPPTVGQPARRHPSRWPQPRQVGVSVLRGFTAG